MESKLSVTYCAERPSPQTALDIFKGAWKSALPPETGLVTGLKQVFHRDPRVLWVKALLPDGFRGMDVLELGPFEGYDSRLFEELGAASVTAVEGNNINFLKCLVLKTALGLETDFLYGGFLEYLKSCERRFDIVWASGVLYHSEDPIELLRQVGERSDRLFLWTHYFADTLVQTKHAAAFDATKNVTRDGMTLHYHSYQLERFRDGRPLHYEGGQEAFSYWMERKDIDSLLGAVGFTSVSVQQDGLNNDMPFVTLFAERGSTR
jgi:hypothetical protein